MTEEELRARLVELESFIAAPAQEEYRNYYSNPLNFSGGYHVNNEGLTEFRNAKIEIREIKYQLMTPEQQQVHDEEWEKIRIKHEDD
ncbi:hypothetical protein [Winogradskyella sp. SYSU M77433]|uniref:hypothetical protein n=1 Tax=Winogradskyella sp. SYSU M77433 TaxID=3042722 RepID=UPI00248099F5|nr:hypothetical protein [Winogradskyella sp. SYSU M77433]MDH7911370.1 hypothetical protein [Winogradskyella sp. SYSU M77433]